MVGMATTAQSMQGTPDTFKSILEETNSPAKGTAISAEDREAYVNNLILSADLVVTDNLIQGCRDTDDDKFLETAVNGDAQFIISGDQNFLAMHRFDGIDIVTVKKFAGYRN